MRKIYILIAALILCSCEETVKIDYDGVETLLQMNSFLDSADSVHLVHLGWSKPGSYEMIKKNEEVHLSMFVNDVMTSSVDTLGCEKGIYVKGRFSAGDVVKLTASVGQACVEAETTAPFASSINRVDTTVADIRRYFTVDVQDRPGEKNYYRISIRKSWQCLIAVLYMECSKKVGDSMGEGYKIMEVDGKDDPIICVNNDLFGDYSGTQEIIFSDDSFRDSHRGFILSTEDDYKPNPWSGSSEYRIDIITDIIVRLHTLSPEAFRYLDDYRFEDSDNSFFMAFPTAYPDNVKGGIGFVSATTSEDYVIHMPVRYY